MMKTLGTLLAVAWLGLLMMFPGSAAAKCSKACKAEFATTLRSCKAGCPKGATGKGCRKGCKSAKKRSLTECKSTTSPTPPDCGSVTTSTSSTTVTVSTVTTTTTPVGLTACNLPLTHDTVDGFHIAVPSGWELLTLRGELEVEKDATADEAVIVSPAIQTSGLTAAGFLQSQLSNFESQAASEGRTITITADNSQAAVPSVSFSAPVNGQTVNGYATVLTQQFGTQLSSFQLAFVAYWAPASSFTSETPTLSGVAACYGPEQASLYHVFQDQVFLYMLPPGWSPYNETQDSIDLVDGNGDYVTYELVGGSQFSDPPSLINVFLSDAGVTPVTALWMQSTPAQQLQNGGTENSEYEEFTATFQGQPVHGLIFALTDTGTGFNTGVVRIVLASAANWNAVNGALFQIVGSIQHNFTQDLQTMQQLNQQWQNFSNQVANFDDILNSQQLTQDPTTGIYYYAPYDSYEVNGPAGPGYYVNDQRLNIIPRS